VLIVDARHGLADLDVELLGSFLGSGRPVLLLATKMDKLTSSKQRDAEQDIKGALAAAFPSQAAQVTIVPFSATRRIGVEAAEAVLGAWLAQGDATSGDAAAAAAKERAPRTRGVSRGPKRPARG
jgi:GTP-binding protein